MTKNYGSIRLGLQEAKVSKSPALCGFIITVPDAIVLVFTHTKHLRESANQISYELGLNFQVSFRHCHMDEGRNLMFISN